MSKHKEPWQDIIWYHGTKLQFDGIRTPAYFTSEKQIAGGYAKGESGGRLIESNLDIKNPKIIKSPRMVVMDKDIRLAKSQGYDSIVQDIGKGQYDAIVFEPTQVNPLLKAYNKERKGAWAKEFGKPLYHGTSGSFEIPSVQNARGNGAFGKGIYLSESVPNGVSSFGNKTLELTVSPNVKLKNLVGAEYSTAPSFQGKKEALLEILDLYKKETGRTLAQDMKNSNLTPAQIKRATPTDSYTLSNFWTQNNNSLVQKAKELWINNLKEQGFNGISDRGTVVLFDDGFLTSKPVDDKGRVSKGKWAWQNKPKLVGIEWRSKIGEKFDPKEGGLVEAKVSDWEQKAKSTASQRDIVHVYLIEGADGVVKPYGKQTAMKELGVDPYKLNKQATEIMRKQSYDKEQRKARVDDFKNRATHGSVADANRAFLVKLPHQTAMDDMNRSSVYEKDGKYLTTWAENEEDVLGAGYKKVRDNGMTVKEGAWAQKNRVRVGNLPKDYSTDAKDFISPDYLNEDDEGTMYHVTTAKDKVIGEGLKSRSDTKSVGLGGGFNNQASDKVSVTFSNSQAQAIAERLRLAVDAAKGKVKSSDVLSIMVEDYRLDDEYPPQEIVDVLGVPSKISNDWDKVSAWVDKEYDPYDVLVKLDDSLPSIFTDAEDFGYRVGLTGTKEQMAQISEDQIEIMEIGAKKGAKPEHIADEAELRFNPQDIWVMHKGRGKKGKWAVIYAPMPVNVGSKLSDKDRGVTKMAKKTPRAGRLCR